MTQCIACRAVIPEGAKFCFDCGKDQSELRGRQRRAESHLEAPEKKSAMRECLQSPVPGLAADDLEMSGAAEAESSEEEVDLKKIWRFLKKDVPTKKDLAALATKADLESVKTEVLNETQATVSSAVDPLKTRLSELEAKSMTKADVEAIVRAELNSQGVSSSSQGKLSELEKLIEQQQRILTRNDPSTKSLTFSGFSTDRPHESRGKDITSFLGLKGCTSTYTISTPQKGPYGARTSLPISVVEFASNTERETVLKLLGDQPQLQSDGATIRVSRSKSEFQRARNWAVKEAARQLGVDESAISWGRKAADDRTIMKDGKVAFRQTKADLRGSFEEGFSHLSLPK